jgi:hypothetical protein
MIVDLSMRPDVIGPDEQPSEHAESDDDDEDCFRSVFGHRVESERELCSRRQSFFGD